MSETTTRARPAGATTIERPAILKTPLARIGLIIPSSNRLAEPQFRHCLPDDIGVHTTRLRMTGPWHKPLGQIHDFIRGAAGALADSECDVIVFNCTGGAMQDGAEEEARVLDLIKAETGAEALSTGEAVVEALNAVDIRSMVLLSPYVQATNDAEIAYLESLGFSVLADRALGLGGGTSYITVDPGTWMAEARALMRADADGLFLSCTNTTQIEIVGAFEAEFDRACVNSNQAVMWAALTRLQDKLGRPPVIEGLGRLLAPAA